MGHLFQQFFFILHKHHIFKISSNIRKIYYTFLGMHIGKRVQLSNVKVIWPHQVSFKDDCIIEKGVYFKFSGIWKQGPSICFGNSVFIGSNCEFNISKKIEIGDNTNIASGCRFIDHDHGTKAAQLIGNQQCVEKEIKIGNDVWLGFNVIVLKGVEINDGAVVAAGSVVTKSIPKLEIWAGVPARKIGERK